MSIDKLKTKFITGAFINDVKHYFSKINEIIDYLNGNGTSGDGSYKVYIALLTQTGTDAPIAIVLKNTIGNINYEFAYNGQFLVKSNLLFLLNKTIVYVGSPLEGANNSMFTDCIYNNESTINLNTTLFNGTSFVGKNEQLYNTPIEIRVYN